MTFATPVPTIPKIITKNMAWCVAGKFTLLEKSVKHKIKIAGISITVKFPVVILKGFTSDRYFFTKFTFVA